jgi:hypothetical protein
MFVYKKKLQNYSEDIRRHRTKVCRRGDQAPGIYAPLSIGLGHHRYSKLLGQVTVCVVNGKHVISQPVFWEPSHTGSLGMSGGTEGKGECYRRSASYIIITN